MKKLGAYTAVNVCLWGGYHWIDAIPQHTVDKVIAAEIFIVCALSSIITLCYSWKYKWFSIGILGFTTGIALLFFPSVADNTMFAIREAPKAINMTTTPRWYMETYRVLLASGGAIMADHLIRFAFKYRSSVFPWFRSGETDSDPLDLLHRSEATR